VKVAVVGVKLAGNAVRKKLEVILLTALFVLEAVVGDAKRELISFVRPKLERRIHAHPPTLHVIVEKRLDGRKEDVRAGGAGGPRGEPWVAAGAAVGDVVPVTVAAAYDDTPFSSAEGGAVRRAAL
jgi:hypothetical protein